MDASIFFQNACDQKILDIEDCRGFYYCGESVVRDGKCEKHKVERRKPRLSGDRRLYGSSDSPPSCNNGLCRTALDGSRVVTVHHTVCPDYGPGWA